MKRLSIISMMCAFIAVPAMADGTAYLDGWMYNYNSTHPSWHGTTAEGWSGTFTATTSGISNSIDGIRFETFCVEKAVVVYVPGTYTAVVNTGAVNGGAGGIGTFDALDPKTAWLYDQYLDGNMMGYSDQNLLARDIQWAIWDIEGEWTLGADATYDGAEALKDLAGLNATGIGDIRVLNLWSGTADMQDILVRVPVPAAVLLGILGLSAAGSKLRKFV